MKSVHTSRIPAVQPFITPQQPILQALDVVQTEESISPFRLLDPGQSQLSIENKLAQAVVESRHCQMKMYLVFWVIINSIAGFVRLSNVCCAWADDLVKASW